MVELPGVDLSLERHLKIWETWVPHMERWAADEGASDRRYHTDNRMFGPVSARLLAGAIGAIKPVRYIEIGSGFSSAVLLDINDEWRSSNPIFLTFIEPFPERLESILRPSDRDRCSIITDKVQAVGLDAFETMEAGDVLFVDSSHVAKSGSDLLRELFDILPGLPTGSFVHFHDIYYPFEYPTTWAIEQNRSWNESYFLRAFLMYNAEFKVHFWTDYFALFGVERQTSASSGLISGRPSSIWLERT